jgi:hypothetical protein
LGRFESICRFMHFIDKYSGHTWRTINYSNSILPSHIQFQNSRSCAYPNKKYKLLNHLVEGPAFLQIASSETITVQNIYMWVVQIKFWSPVVLHHFYWKWGDFKRHTKNSHKSS